LPGDLGTVFISYTHDGADHARVVLSLSNRLRTEGIDCVLDQYESSPPEGWPQWMDREIKKAQFVLMVCTEAYYRRVMGEEVPGIGLGIAWEGNLIYNHIYSAGSRNTKFIPVIFDAAHAVYIPTPAQGATRYCASTPDGYEQLYSRLVGKPPADKPPLGKRKALPQREVKTTFFGPSGGSYDLGRGFAFTHAGVIDHSPAASQHTQGAERQSAVSNPLQIEVGQHGPFFNTNGKGLYRIERTLNIKIENIGERYPLTGCKVYITKIEPSESTGPWLLKEGFSLAAGDQIFIPLVVYGEAREPNKRSGDSFMVICVPEPSPKPSARSTHVMTLKATTLDGAPCEFRCKLWVDEAGRLRIEKI
jgi:hypothetical protein